MTRIDILLLACTVLAVSCNGKQDNRFFAPEVTFGEEVYPADAEAGGMDVVLLLSRPAPMPFQIGLNFSGTLREDVQFRVPSHTVNVAEGDREARLHVELLNDEIWDEESWIGISIAPGSRYTVDPDGNCITRIAVSKAIVLPKLHLTAPGESVRTNPFRAETIPLGITAEKAPSADLTVQLDLDGLIPGTDCLIDGSNSAAITFPAGKNEISFELAILRKDESGYDRHATLSLAPQKGVYVADGSVDLHLSDPVVDFSPLWKTSALNNGTGYQLRQAIKTPEGEWSGNLAADFYVSSEGSNYLRNFRNMYDSQWSCLANSPGGNALRLTEFFPLYDYKHDPAILDYGSASNTRTFSPTDSLMRFVLDDGETQKGDILLTHPRTFTAILGTYADWQADVAGGKAWQADSKATGGQILASTHSAIKGRVTVTLQRLEGRFDLSDKTAPLEFTAWFRSDDARFMDGVDRTQFDLMEEDGLWKVSYRLWPR